MLIEQLVKSNAIISNGKKFLTKPCILITIEMINGLTITNIKTKNDYSQLFFCTGNN